jgi:pimeloyl-ACP methyl ester carboxylesterase
MPISSNERRHRDIQVGNLQVRVQETGSGPTVVVLHHSSGPFWTPFHDQLGERYSVAAVEMPGYGQSERPAFARSPRDIAILCMQAVAKIAGPEPVHLVGFGLGGWVAAEMATMSPLSFTTLTLGAPAGIKPREGFIHDPMKSGWVEYARLGFSTDEAFDEVFGPEPPIEVTEVWDYGREMTARITWRPWMWSGQLPHLLPGVEIPALVVWGDKDRVIPLVCGEQYAELLPSARLEVLGGVGHSLEIEQPQLLAEIVTDFLIKQGA